MVLVKEKSFRYDILVLGGGFIGFFMIIMILGNIFLSVRFIKGCFFRVSFGMMNIRDFLGCNFVFIWVFFDCVFWRFVVVYVEVWFLLWFSDNGVDGLWFDFWFFMFLSVG